MRKKNIPLRNCITCNSTIPRNTKQGEKRIRPAQYIKAKFCSLKYKGIFQKEMFKGQNNPNWKGGNTKCFDCKKDLGIRYSSRNIKFCKSCWYKNNRNENHWNWQNGITEKELKERGRIEYKQWRKSVFERDDYTCVWCGDNRGGNLNADHIKPFALYPELRFDLSNGRTLCVDCHKKTDTWGYKTRKLKIKIHAI